MTSKKQLAVSAVATASMLFAGAAPALAASPEQSGEHTQTIATGVAQSSSESAQRTVDASTAQVSWDQTTLTPNAIIRDVFRTATNALCNATTDFAMDNPLQWRLTISGDVNHAFTATIDELAQEQSVQQTMTCSCGGNPSDGKAIITAAVKGIPANYLVGKAGAQSDVNTMTFVCSDGTEVAMPLAYVIGRHGVISYEINDEDLSASVGGNNQLWLAGTSANYFVRDIVEIRITHEDVVPANPGEGKEYPNSPNVGILGVSAA
ncbi:MAG: molybdopterin-dependent oxidoreductase [Raoultibacter sp.]